MILANLAFAASASLVFWRAKPIRGTVQEIKRETNKPRKSGALNRTTKAVRSIKDAT